jgi:hypothetical protein
LGSGAAAIPFGSGTVNTHQSVTANNNLGSGAVNVGNGAQIGVNGLQMPVGAAGSVNTGTHQTNAGVTSQGQIGGQLNNSTNNQLPNRNNNWRSRFFNGLWWYWMPNTNQWMFFQNGTWHLFTGPVEGITPNTTPVTNISPPTNNRPVTFPRIFPLPDNNSDDPWLYRPGPRRE